MSKRNRRNYYRLLHVQSDAPVEVIKAGYRILMQKLRYHLDLGGNEWNAALINEAYAVLSDAGRRDIYDREQRNLVKSTGSTACSSSTPAPKPATPKPTQPTGSAGSEPTDLGVCAFCRLRTVPAISGLTSSVATAPDPSD